MRLIWIALAVGLTMGALAGDAYGIGLYATYWNADALDNGAGFGAKQKILPLPIIGVDVRASYLRFGDASVNVFPLEAAAYVDFWLLYGGAGLGYYIFDSSLKDDVGAFLLVGGKFAPAGFGVFGELTYRFLETGTDDVKASADGLGFNVGVLIGF